MRDDAWFIEKVQPQGTGFALQIEELLHDVHSPFQHLQVYKTTHFGYLMLLDGCIMLTSRDNFLYHEMMTHPALLMHPHPEQVVIIGGGDCGSLKEVLKHPTVRSAVQIDIDQEVTKASELYFPELCEKNHDPRAQILFQDGVKWIQDREANSIDVLIIDSTDPVGPAEGLFSGAFYQDCLRVLKNGGIVIAQSESPLLHADSIIAPLHQTMLQAGFQDTRTLHFPQPVYPSGWWSATLACKNKRLQPQTFRAEALEPLNTQYYSPGIHQNAFALPPFLERAIAHVKTQLQT